MIVLIIATYTVPPRGLHLITCGGKGREIREKPQVQMWEGKNNKTFFSFSFSISLSSLFLFFQFNDNNLKKQIKFFFLIFSTQISFAVFSQTQFPSLPVFSYYFDHARIPTAANLCKSSPLCVLA